MTVTNTANNHLIVKPSLKKELQRINWKIITKLIVSLHYNSKIKKTNLAMKCNLSYDKCCMYLNWLEMFSLIKRDVDEDNYETISLSDVGIEFYYKQFNNLTINSL